MIAGVPMAFAAGFDRAQETVLTEHDTVRHHLALRDRRAESPGGGNQHLPFGGLAEPPPDARAAISGWISTPIAVSAGDSP